ncbi:MAG: hypothetical protein ACXWZL_06525 [Mycobacterium sp.]
MRGLVLGDHIAGDRSAAMTQAVIELYAAPGGGQGRASTLTVINGGENH